MASLKSPSPGVSLNIASAEGWAGGLGPKAKTMVSASPTKQLMVSHAIADCQLPTAA